MTSADYSTLPPGTLRFFPVGYALLAGCGLLFALFTGFSYHRTDLLSNGCNVPEFLPSISATIGDFIPERQIFRFCSPILFACLAGTLFGIHRINAARVGASTTSSSSSLGHHHHHPASHHTSKSSSSIYYFFSIIGRLVFGSCELYEAHTVLNCLRFFAGFGWTYIASSESLFVHQASFGFYAVFGILQHFIAFVIARRLERSYLSKNVISTSTSNNILPKNHSQIVSALSKAKNMKLAGLIGQLIAILLFVKFFVVDHMTHCRHYAYSTACFFEWTFSYLDLFLDASYYYDMLAVDLAENCNDGSEVVLLDTVVDQQQQQSSSDPENKKSQDNSLHQNDSTHTQEGPEELESTQNSTTSQNNNAADPFDEAPDKIDDFTNFSNNTNQQTATLPVTSATSTSATTSSMNRKTIRCTSEKYTKYISNYTWIPTSIIHNGAPRILLWIADSFFGYMLFGSTLAAFQAIYFVPMVAMTFTPEVALIIGPVAAAFVFKSQILMKLFFPVASHTTPESIFKPSRTLYVVYGLASLSFLGVMVEKTPGNKIILTCLGPGLLWIAFRVRSVLHSMRHAVLEKSRSGFFTTIAPQHLLIRDELRDEASRLCYACPIGLAFSLVVRYYFISIDPFYTYAHFAPIATCICLLVFIPVLIFQENFLAIQVSIMTSASSSSSQQSSSGGGGKNSFSGSGNSGTSTPPLDPGVPYTMLMRYSTNVSPIHNSWIIGASFGAVSFLALQYCSAANVIPRLIAIDPLSGVSTFLIILSFCAGIFASVIYAHPRDPKHRFILQAMLLAGPILLFYGTMQSNKMTQTDKNRLEAWGTNEFYGSPNLAFVGGMMFVFSIGAILPATCAAFWGLPVSLGLLNDGRLHDRPIAVSVVSSGLFQTDLISSVIHILQVLGSVYVVCFPFVPGGWIFGDRYQLYLFPPCLIAFFTQRYLFHPSEYYTEKEHGTTSEEDISNNMTGSSPFASALYRDGKHSPPTVVTSSNNNDVGSETSNEQQGATSTSSPSKPTTHKRLDSVYSYSDLDFAPMTPLATGDTGVYPIPFETHRVRISVRILIVGMFLAFIWRMVQNPGSNSRDPYGRDTATDLVDTQGNLMSRPDEYNTLTADMYEHKHGTRKFLMETSTLNPAIDGSNRFAHITSAIWTIHFGLDNFGIDSLPQLAKEIRNARVSVMGLLETDSARVQTANRDIVEYLAYNTGLVYTDYGPTTADSTFGCALLSRYPIVSVRRIVAPSPMGELACIIDAVLEIPDHEKRTRGGKIINKQHLRVLVGHNGNTDHVQDLVLQTDLIGRIAAEAAVEGQPIIFLGYVTQIPGIMTHNYYRMVQSDGREFDRLVQRSSTTLYSHGFDPIETGKGIELPKIPMPKQRNRFRDAARDYLLWSGSLSVDTLPGAVSKPAWTNSKHLGEKSYWEAHVKPATEWAFLQWLDKLSDASDVVAKAKRTEEWRHISATSHDIRRQLELAAHNLWEDVASQGLGVCTWQQLNKKKVEHPAESEYNYDVIASHMHTGRIFRTFLDHHWLDDNAAKHQYVETRYFNIVGEAPKYRPQHPRFEYEDRYCQQIYYRDVMILQWYRSPIGDLSDTELQVFTFGM